MYSAQQVDNDIANWRGQGFSRAELAVKIADDCMGWPYVWGGDGQYDTPSNRETFANRSSCPEAESSVIRKRCQVLNGSRSSCDGCKYYPNAKTRFFDCRGFTRWVLKQVGITINGAGATSQYNDNSNWTSKGKISAMPQGVVCCVFMQNGDKMSHTGLYVGNGIIIHCSGEVKRGSVNDKGWSHFAIPKGIEGDVPVWRPTIRRGSTGDDVVYVQEILIQLGYDLGASGADGKFGAKTEAAVKAFQRASGLNADGVVGPLTYEALEKAQPDGSLYTVTIPHVTKFKAEALVQNYAGASMKKEE